MFRSWRRVVRHILKDRAQSIVAVKLWARHNRQRTFSAWLQYWKVPTCVAWVVRVSENVGLEAKKWGEYGAFALDQEFARV